MAGKRKTVPWEWDGVDVDESVPKKDNGDKVLAACISAQVTPSRVTGAEMQVQVVRRRILGRPHTYSRPSRQADCGIGPDRQEVQNLHVQGERRSGFQGEVQGGNRRATARKGQEDGAGRSGEEAHHRGRVREGVEDAR